MFDEDDKEVKRMWAVRFYYFLFEWVRWFKRHQKEQEIMAATKGWKQFEKEWSRHEATLTDEEKIPLWTKESFSYWFDKHVLLSYEEIVKRRKKKRRKKEKDSPKCSHLLGYLRSLPDSEAVPRECTTCQNLLECRNLI